MGAKFYLSKRALAQGLPCNAVDAHTAVKTRAEHPLAALKRKNTHVKHGADPKHTHPHHSLSSHAATATRAHCTRLI